MRKSDVHAILYDSYVRTLEKPYIKGSGIYQDQEIGFDYYKSEQYKGEIAKFLDEIGIADLDMVSLGRLVETKEGKRWMNIKSDEDFQILNSFIAYLVANKFLTNNVEGNEKNPKNRFIIYSLSRLLLGTEKYLGFLTKYLNNINFQVNGDIIKSTINKEDVKTLIIK